MFDEKLEIAIEKVDELPKMLGLTGHQVPSFCNITEVRLTLKPTPTINKPHGRLRLYMVGRNLFVIHTVRTLTNPFHY